MKQLRITPLNIVSALVMTWLFWRIIADEMKIGSIGWFLLLLLILVVADQFFRLMLRSLKRVWLTEGIFVIFVVLAIWVLKVW